MNAVYDLWLLGADFLKDIYGEFKAIRFQAKQNEEETPPFIQEYYNVREFYKPTTAGIKYNMTRMINSLLQAVKERKRLPKYLIIIMDRDIIHDLSDVLDPIAHLVLAEITRWFVRQIDSIMRRKRLDFLEKKPGAFTGFLSTKVIYVRMLRRIGSFNSGSKTAGVMELRPKFNDVLNDELAKLNQYILTINSCNTYDHFDRYGNLSPKGKECFWWELDDLIERFNIDKVKLLPNPKNPPQFNHGNRNNKRRRETPQKKRKLPTPPGSRYFKYY